MAIKSACSFMEKVYSSRATLSMAGRQRRWQPGLAPLDGKTCHWSGPEPRRAVTAAGTGAHVGLSADLNLNLPLSLSFFYSLLSIPFSPSSPSHTSPRLSLCLPLCPSLLPHLTLPLSIALFASVNQAASYITSTRKKPWEEM